MGTVVNVQHAKAHLSALIAAAERGETIIIGRAGAPAVTLVPVTATTTPPRTFGTMPGFVVPDDFDAPMPDSELATWE